MRKKVSVSVAIAITFIAMTVTFSITMIVSMNIFDNAVKDVIEKQSIYSKISELDNYIRANFYGDIDDQAMSDKVAQGFIEGLSDPGSTYYTAEEYAYLQDIEAGRIVGVGLVTVKDASTGHFRIIKVYDGSPAAGQGMQEELLITEVDGVASRNITSTGRLNTLLRGEQGTSVTINCIDRQGNESSFTIQRVNYTNTTVESTIFDGYAYIRIYSFTADTAADFDYLLQEAEAANVKGYVFDLRNTTAGYAEYSFDILDSLCPLGTIARELRKDGVVRSLRMSDDENQIEKPMVCIVNENTAGTAELFAATVRDLAGGWIVGAQTAGKGTLQRAPQQLLDGSAVAVTYALLFAAEQEESFNGVGFVPDIEAANSLDSDAGLYSPNPDMDRQLSRALELARSQARTMGLETGPAAEEGESPTEEEAAGDEQQIEGEAAGGEGGDE